MSRRHALLIGINQYPHFADDEQLQGAVNDIEQLADLLVDRFSFSYRNLLRLRNEEATRANILRALDDLVTIVEPGDPVVVHFSGHGSQIADREGDEPDGFDETLVPWDGHRHMEDCRDISDDEIFLWLDRMCRREAFVTLILDCCHSGHALRHGEIRGRRVAKDQRTAEQLPPSPIGQEDLGRLTAGGLASLPRRERGVLLAACREGQEAFERYQRSAHEATHGYWSFALLRVLRHATGDLTAREAFEEAHGRLVRAGVPQKPQIAGARDRLLFDSRMRPPARFVEVQRVFEGKQVELAAGAAFGLAAGSLWQIHRRQTRQPSESPCLARARLASVGALSSIAELDLPSLDVEPGCRAFQCQPAHEDHRLRVAIETSADRDATTWLEQAIDSSPVLRRVSSPAFDVLLAPWPSSSGESWWHLQSPQRRPISEPYDSHKIWLPGGLLERLERRARCEHARRLENLDPTSKLEGRIDLILWWRAPRGYWQPTSQSSRAGPIYPDGGQLGFELRHHGEVGLYVYVVDLGTNDVVSLLFPEAGAEELLEPDLGLKVGLRLGDEIDVNLPPDTDFESKGGHLAHGALKVFLTTHPVDFDWLISGVPAPVFRGSGSQLERLLAMDLARPEWRSASEADTDDLGEDWATTLYPYRVQPKPEEEKPEKTTMKRR